MQFEDFFVLSLGEVDARPSYHNVSQIWPVGYRSCWHDRITGSLFLCEVLDGGDSGPIFRVRRCSCSAMPIPNGITVLCGPKLGHFAGQTNEKSDYNTCHYMDGDNDGSIQMILSDPCPPSETDILSCLGIFPNGACDVHKPNRLLVDSSSIDDKSGSVPAVEVIFRDEIGEISAEDRSSSSAWRLMSKKFLTACSEICKQKGTLKFSCKHAEKGIGMPNYYATMDESNMTSLVNKFCCQLGSLSIPSVFKADNELDTSLDVLEKWLEQDRFGLDVDFVQEIIEQLPGVEACSCYELLTNRSKNSTSLTVGSGLLMARLKGGVHCVEEEDLGGLFRRYKKARLAEDHVVYTPPPPPPGKPLCSRIPPELVGDVYQVCPCCWVVSQLIYIA